MTTTMMWQMWLTHSLIHLFAFWFKTAWVVFYAIFISRQMSVGPHRPNTPSTGCVVFLFLLQLTFLWYIDVCFACKATATILATVAHDDDCDDDDNNVGRSVRRVGGWWLVCFIYPKNAFGFTDVMNINDVCLINKLLLRIIAGAGAGFIFEKWNKTGNTSTAKAATTMVEGLKRLEGIMTWRYLRLRMSSLWNLICIALGKGKW